MNALYFELVVLAVAALLLIGVQSGFIAWLFRREILMVFHQDSPGTRVLVRRNAFGRLFRSRTFSSIGEKHWTPDACLEHACSKENMQTEIDTLNQEFDEWLAWCNTHDAEATRNER